MKVVALIARILLGLVFVVFGSNLLAGACGHPFIPMTPPPGAAGQLLGALFTSHFIWLIGFCQLVGGILMLAGVYVTLGLVILGPVIVCIDFFHLSVAQSGIPLAAVVTLLWFLVYWPHRHHLAGIFAKKA